MKNSRQRILEFFDLRDIVSAREIARAMHMTAANARHHLRILVEDGVVVIAGHRLTPGRGRPEQIYQLAKRAGANSFTVLSSSLLSKSLRNLSEDERLDFMRQIAQEILSGYEIPKTINLGVRLQQAVRKLNEMHYQSRWEARAKNPRLILGHCPYRAILDQFPELCLMDKFITGHLSGAQMEQIARLDEVGPGVRHCIFQVQG